MDALRSYLKEIGQFSVLTADEERELAYKIRIGKDAQQELSEQGEDCSPERVSVLQDLIEDGDFAREELVNHNLKLVVSIAKNYRNSHLELMDLIGEGNRGLMTAVEKFNPDLGWRFSTCATPWIKQAITKSIIDNGKTIRIPAHIYQLLSKLRQAINELSKTGNVPSEQEIADYMNITVEKVRELQQWRHDTVSLETPLGDEEEDTLLELQADPSSENGLQYTIRENFAARIQEMLSKMKPRTQQIMKMRFGLGKENDPEDWGQEHTLEEIGAAVGLTRERVRQIVMQTLQEMREEWKQ